MLDFDKWQEIISTMWRHKLRTALTAFGVFWGMLMLVVLLGLGNGIQNGVKYQFRDDATNSLWVNSGRTSLPQKGIPAGRSVQFRDGDLEDVKENVEGVGYITARYHMRNNIVARKNLSTSFDVRATHADHLYLENTIVTKGRFLNPLDVTGKRKICVIGEAVYDYFFEKNEVAIGQYIKIDGIQYRIVGRFTDEGSPSEAHKIYIPVTTGQQVTNGQDKIDRILLTTQVSTLEETYRMEDDVRDEIAANHNFSAKDEDAVYIFNMSEMWQEFVEFFTILDGFLWFVGICTLIAGMIGVSNIMLITVKERTREIGIRKALGATPFSVVSMILQESVFLTAIAGYLGMLGGIVVVQQFKSRIESGEIQTEFIMNPTIDFNIVLVSLSILVAVGAVAGLIPALNAARISPVVAMKGE